ncbi:MAG: hypothetical protein ACREFZ_07885 [Acetobacteraceae bacterium]
MNTYSELLGIGLYTVGEAARLAEVSPARVRGWVRGYDKPTTHKPRPAVVGHALPELDGKLTLTFRELIEVRFVRHFLQAGVSWRAIRRAATEARRDLLGSDARTLRFSTDGVTIFANTLAEGGDRKARDLVQNQYVLQLIIAQSIRPEFDIEASAVIRAWHPRRAAMPAVFLDPRRSFGRPLVEPGIPTRALASALAAESGDVAAVARIFDTSDEQVRAAALFEATVAA